MYNIGKPRGKNMNKLKNGILSTILILVTVSACTNAPIEEENLLPVVGEDLRLLDNIEFDYEHAVFDDFSSGVDKTRWYIGNQAWGGNNGGVIPANVNYTDDGILVLTGNGKYYSDHDVRGVGDVKDGRYTGAALVSKFKVHTGRFEIKMKVLPRLGACTAFWTYANEATSGANHEIDIELPGGNIDRPISFENVLNTNYITERFKQSQDIKVSSLSSEENEVYLNDGEFHTFGFDWYTDPELIIYYVDGKISAISDVFIPNYECRLWFGCWFPVSSAFVGTANFEKDNMYVDYVKYLPFKNQPYETFEPPFSGYALDNEYPTTPIPVPTISKISNGTFENLTLQEISENTNEIELYGWNLTKKINEDQPLASVIDIVDNEGYDHSKALLLKDGGVAYQNIDSIYHNFQYDLSFYAKGKGRAIVSFYGKTNTEALFSKTININQDELTLFSEEFIAPEGSQSLEIDFDTSKENSLLIDNLSLIKK